MLLRAMLEQNYVEVLSKCRERQNWMSVLIGSVEECWSKFKSVVLGLRNKFVPVRVVKDKGKVPLKWIKKKHGF